MDATLLNELDREAWLAHYREPGHALDLAQRLIHAAAGAAEWLGRGEMHRALAAARLGRRADCDISCERLRGLARHADDPALDALLRDVQAVLLRMDRRHAEALALLETNLTIPEEVRGLPASIQSHTVASQCCMALGLLDRSLQLRYHALGLAERLEEPAIIANACANLAGVQNDLLNLEDGYALSARALEAADQAGLQGVPLWLTAAFNLTTAQLQRQDPQAALATARRMQAHQESVPAAKRGRYEVLWATAAVLAGLNEEAERWLDAAYQRWSRREDVIVEWYLTRAMLHNRQGDARAARGVCDLARALTQSAGEEILPIDAMQLYEEGVLACEALGDLQAALGYKRLAFEQYELMAGRSARARRVTAEIQHHLDLIRRARDEAQRRRQDAEIEKARLAQLNDALHEAGQARARFLAAASHDLRQPLHALGLQVAHLSEQVGDGAAQETVSRMARSVGALASMFDGLLDLSRIEAGAVEPRWQSVAIVPLLVGLVEEHASQAERRGLRLALHVPPRSHGLQLRSDPVLLDRLLRNLIGNALKYSAQGGVLVALRRTRPAADGTSCGQIRIFDTGIGIAQPEQQRIFEAFYRVDGEMRQQVQGLGLGLSIVQRLALLLGLPLHLRSQPGRGSVFGVGLPGLADDTRAPAALSARPVEPAEAAQRSRGAIIALAEDDDEVREMMSQWLQAFGLRVVAAHTGDALLERLDREPVLQPRALITDGRMPGKLDGWALSHEWAKRFGAAAPVLIITGEASLPAIPPGAQVLRKPVRDDQLRAWLAQSLHSA